MDPVKTLCYGIACKVGFVTASAVTEIRRIAMGEYRVAYASGGKSVASGSINGESVSFAVSSVQDPAQLLALCLETERRIKDMTDEEFEDFIYLENVGGIRPSFAGLNV